MNKELYDYLHEHDFYLNKGEFRYCTEKYGKEEFRLTIADYVSVSYTHLRAHET